MPNLRFKGFTDDWEQRKLIDGCEYVDYRGKTPNKTENGVFLVTAKNVKAGYIDYEASQEYIAEEDYDEVMHRGMPQIGDVLITTEAPCGNVAQVDREDIALAQRIIKYRGHENQIDNTLTDAKKAAPASVVGEIKNAVILPEKCVKFGNAGMITNERLDLDTGAIVTNSSGQTRTDYIPVNVGDYVQTCAIRDICLYDDQFAYIGFISLWSVNDTPAPPASWSGNYNSNITQITAINGINPSYIRCWGRYDQYPPAVTMLSGEPYKVLNLGDSIFGNNEKPWDLGTYIQNITGLKDANCGYGGTTARVIPSGNMSPLGLPSIVNCIVSEDFSPLKTPAYWASLQEYRYGVPTLLFDMIDFSKIEVITIAYGTNDWNSDTPLDDTGNRLDTSTYKGGLRYAVENLQTKYPAITLVMLSPIFRYWSNASDYSTVDRDSDTRTNSLGLKLTDYVTAMQEVAEEYHLPFYNNYDGIGLNRYTAPTWLRDGTHLNRGIGVDKMGHIVAKEVGEIY